MAKTYTEDVRCGIPCAAEQIDVMLRILQARNEPFHRFADLGCGNGILAAAILSKYPKVSGILVDFSPAMIGQAKEELRAYATQLRFVVADLRETDWLNVFSDERFDAVVSGYAIHHLTDETKRKLFSEIFDLLEPGGVFVNVDHVSSSTGWVQGVSDKLHVDALETFHRTKGSAKTRQEIESLAFRPDQQANILASAESQCEWLREIGFNDVDCYFKVFERAVFGGRRPA